jgi:glycosyltransferase involved in cell wall biosynthesis
MASASEIASIHIEQTLIPLMCTSNDLKKKIIFVFGALEMGGAERQALALARHLKDCEAEVQIWAFHPGKMAAICADANIPTRVLKIGWGASLLSKLLALRKFSRLVRAERADLLLPFTLVPNVFCSFVKTVPCIWGQRDEGLESFSAKLEWIALRRANGFVANSIAGEKWLRIHYERAKVDVIPNGVSLKPVQRSRNEWRQANGIDPATTIFIMVANLSRHKDHATLLKAWSAALSEVGTGKVMLLLAGRRDDATAAIETLIDELGLNDTVRMLGPVDDISGLLAASDVFVLSSRSEGLSNAVLEATLSGLPVLGTDIPGISSALSAENHPYLAAAGDVTNLSRIICVMYSSPSLRKSVGDANRSIAEADFSINEMCVRYTRTISAVLGKLH